jgi:hypothetical protein
MTVCIWLRWLLGLGRLGCIPPGCASTAAPSTQLRSTGLSPASCWMLSLGRPELATVVLAVVRGLLLDLAATGDSARTHQAFNDFLTTIDNA